MRSSLKIAFAAMFVAGVGCGASSAPSPGLGAPTLEDAATPDNGPVASVASDATNDVKTASDAADLDTIEGWTADGDGADGEVIVPGTPCDDGNACSGPDRWSTQLLCTGPILACDDDRPCTQDHCYEKVGCTHVATPGCDSACPECPVALGFACDTTVSPPICTRESSHEIYVPSGLFWFGFNDKALDYPSLAWLVEDQSAFQIFLPGFIVDDDRIGAKKYGDGMAPGGSEDLSPPSDCSQDVPLPGFNVWSCQADCESLGKRLCWESEWEKTAVGGCAQLGIMEDAVDACRDARRLYPWGDELPAQCYSPGPYSHDYDCGLPTSPDGKPISDRSIYGARCLTGLYGEGSNAVVVGVIGIDGVAPPPGFPLDWNGQVHWDHDNPLATDKGAWWLPSFISSSPFQPSGAPWGSRCCTSVDPTTLVLPGEEPPWPPELQ